MEISTTLNTPIPAPLQVLFNEWKFQPYLDVFAVVAPCGQLDASEGDGAFQRHLDGRLLHAVLPVERGVARRRRYAAEVTLNWNGQRGRL